MNTFKNLIILLENNRKTPEQIMSYADIFLMNDRITAEEYQQLYELCYPVIEELENPSEDEDEEEEEDPGTGTE